jgi:uncharacterized membrane protein
MDSRTLLLAAGLGAVSGLRSVTGLAILSRELSSRRGRSRGRLHRVLALPSTSHLLALMAAGEMLADKLPMIPARIAPLPLAGRMGMGAAAGAAAAEHRRDSLVAGALVGGAAAVAAAYAGYHARRALGRRLSLPDGVVAAAEDGITLTAASVLARSV